ncbi:MAG: acyl-CoA dehydrogenase family protein [Deltaproteobacteria bacterium]|nr:acyl-CoA dehydrogenase family protein [Deltaproteobacteria bacterium]
MSLSEGDQAVEEAKRHLDRIGQALVRKTTVGGKISGDKIDENQLEAYQFAWLSSELYAAESILTYAASRGALEKGLASLFVEETVADLSGKRILKPSANYSQLARLIRDQGHGGDFGLDERHRMFRETFKKFAEEKVAPLAEKVHRNDLLIPQEIMDGLKELGCFGLSMPQRYGGFQDDQRQDNTGMVVVTEELSRGSLGIAGSLITRPEILAKALLKGGTEEQKQKWLPLLATGERMAAVAATEPDYGSDVASMKVTAIRHNGGWRINGVKTWCTFAGYADTLMVLARTDPDPSKRHKGLSLFIVEKPRFEGHEFRHVQPEKKGTIEGKAIPTIGYRGMHSYEVAFAGYWVPDENLIGGEKGLGNGFYLQMEGFSGGRLQTAARALGVMQAAFEAVLRYSGERKVFGKPIFDYQMTQWKIARMASLIQAARQATYSAARLMDEGKGQMESSLVKFYASKIAEWVTREAMQIHGGYGYAEEYPVSRYFVDARVFSIFEGAEEVLALKVITPALLQKYL